MDSSPADDLEVLARCVGDVGSFAATRWGRQPLLRRATGSFEDLLDVEAIESILVRAARRPTFRLVRDGETLAPERYTTTVRLGGGTVTDAADLGRIAEFVADGATLVLQGLQRTWLPLVRFCRSLERATSHPVQANAYLTPAGAAGLRRHVDAHDVIVLQVIGTKGWEVDGLGELALAAGDVLYLPTGTSHRAVTQSDASLHITIGLLRVTYRHVVARLLEQPDVDLDRPLPLGFARPDGLGAGELAEGLKGALAATAARLDATDVDALAATEAARAARRRTPLWTGQLRSVLALGALDDGTRLRRRVDNPASVRDGEPGRITLALVDRTLELPAFVRPALEVVLDADELAVSELVGLDEAGRAVLARRLVREGLLEVVAP